MREIQRNCCNLILLALAGCATAPEERAGETSHRVFTALPAKTPIRKSVIWDLTTEQTMALGTVAVTNDAEHLYVQFVLDHPSSTFEMLRIWAGTSVGKMPVTADGTPIPEQFCSAVGGACFSASGLTSYTFKIALAELGVPDITQVSGTSLYVVPHAEVNMDPNGDGVIDRKTAFGGCNPGAGVCSWLYGQYTNTSDPRYPIKTASRWLNASLYAEE